MKVGLVLWMGWLTVTIKFPRIPSLLFKNLETFTLPLLSLETFSAEARFHFTGSEGTVTLSSNFDR